MTAKCYAVQDGEVSILAWASSPSKAKAVVLCGSEWMEHSEYLDLRCRRMPQFDGLREDGYCSGGSQAKDDFRLMRNAGWLEFDGNDHVCYSCELYEWECIPESEVGADGLCSECRAEKEAELTADRGDAQCAAERDEELYLSVLADAEGSES